MSFQHMLVDYLPKAGMVYPDPFIVLTRNSRDAHLSNALKTQGIIANGKSSTKQSKIDLEAALVAMFILAASDAGLLGLMATGGVLDFESKLKEKTPWAVNIGEPVFIEFCMPIRHCIPHTTTNQNFQVHVLVGAREQYHQTPRFPFDPNQHSALARQIDIFLETAADAWVRAKLDKEFYEIAGGLDDDEDE